MIDPSLLPASFPREFLPSTDLADEATNAYAPWLEATRNWSLSRRERDDLLHAGYYAPPTDPREVLSEVAPYRGLVERILARHGDLLSLLDEGLARGRLRFPDRPVWNRAPRRDCDLLIRLHQIEELLLMRAMLSAGDGRYGEACDDLIRAHRMASILGASRGQNGAWLDGLLINLSALSATKVLTTAIDMPLASLVGLQRQLDALRPSRTVFIQGILGDFWHVVLRTMEEAPDDSDPKRLIRHVLRCRKAVEWSVECLYGGPSGVRSWCRATLGKAGRVLPWLRMDTRGALAHALRDHPRPFDKQAVYELMTEQFVQLLETSTGDPAEVKPYVEEALDRLWEGNEPYHDGGSRALSIIFGRESPVWRRSALGPLAHELRQIDSPLGTFMARDVATGVLNEFLSSWDMWLVTLVHSGMVRAVLAARIAAVRTGETPKSIDDIVEHGGITDWPTDPWSGHPLVYLGQSGVICSCESEGDIDELGRFSDHASEEDEDGGYPPKMAWPVFPAPVG